MSNGNYTPGVWEVETGEFNVVSHYSIWAKKPDGQFGDTFKIADIPRNIIGISFETQLANARLIAAAPDLLEALKELVDLMDGVRKGEYKPDSFTVQPALNAIIKAEGK